MVIQNNKQSLVNALVLNHCHGRSAVQKLIVKLFDFIKNLAQIIKKISKVRQKKNKLIYAEMIKVVSYMPKLGV